MYCHKNIKYFPDKLLKSFDNLSDFSISLIEAPLGSGKTTAINNYLKKSDFKNIIRLTLSQENISLFFIEVLSSLKKISSSPLVISDYSDNCENFSKFLSCISLSKKTAVVVSCVHFLPYSFTDTFISTVLSSCPYNLSFILESCSESSSLIYNSVINDRLNYITSSVFIFGRADIKKYFKLSDITLTEEEASAIYLATNGKIEHINFYLTCYIRTNRLELSFKVDEISLIFHNRNFIFTFFKKFLTSYNYMAENPFLVEVLFFMKESNLFSVFIEKTIEDLRKTDYSLNDKKAMLDEINLLLSVFDSMPHKDCFNKNPLLIFTEYDLTNRELEIVQLVSKRYSNKEIAQELYLSENTVKSYMKIIFRKIGISSRKDIYDKF